MAPQRDYAIHPDYIEQLFEWVYCDLGQRWKATRKRDASTPYHCLNMARLLRHLLSDGSPPLAQLAARRHKFKLLFLTAQVGPAPASLRSIPPEFEDAKPDLSASPPGYYVHAHNRDSYLKHRIGNLGDQWLTVLDVIEFLANSYGGVHLAPNLKEDDEKHFANWNNRLKVAGRGVMFERLDQIVPVVLRSLRPLRRVILAHHDAQANP